MLEIIGLGALSIASKFLWDTYVTGKTDKDWESYKKNEPEKAARIVNSTTFDMSTDYKPNSMHQQISLNMIAALFKCDASEAEETYKKVKREELAINFGNVEKFKQDINEAKQHKYKQAVSMEVDPNNTPAAFLERWMQEIFNEFIQSGVSVQRVLFKANSLTSKHQYKDALALLSGSYKMVDNGEMPDINNLKPFLLNAIGDCHLALEENSKAWFFFSAAISHLEKTSPDNEEARNQFLLNKENAESNAASVAESVLAEFDRETKSVKPSIDTEDLLMEASALASANQHEDVLNLVARVFAMIDNGELIDNSEDTDNLVSFLFNARGESYLILNNFFGAYHAFELAIINFKNINQSNKIILRRIIDSKNTAYDKTDKSVEFSNPVQKALEAEDASSTAKLYASVSAAFGAKPKPQIEQVDEPVADESEEATDKAQMSAEAKANAIKQEARQARVDAAKAAIKAALSAIKVASKEPEQQDESFKAGDEVPL